MKTVELQRLNAEEMARQKTEQQRKRGVAQEQKAQLIMQFLPAYNAYIGKNNEDKISVYQQVRQCLKTLYRIPDSVDIDGFDWWLQQRCQQLWTIRNSLKTPKRRWFTRQCPTCKGQLRKWRGDCSIDVGFSCYRLLTYYCCNNCGYEYAKGSRAYRYAI